MYQFRILIPKFLYIDASRLVYLRILIVYRHIKYANEKAHIPFLFFKHNL